MVKLAKEEEDSPELKTVYLSIGQRIRELREQRSFSQKELASRAGIRQPYLAEIELVGINLSLRLLLSIAGALDVSLRDLLPGSGTSVDYEDFAQGCPREDTTHVKDRSAFRNAVFRAS